MNSKVWFKIGEMADKAGVSPKELRYWERVIPDLCPRRSKGNLRYYHVEALNRLLSIKGWLSAGYSVSDCKDLLLGKPIEPPVAPPLALTEALELEPAKPSKSKAVKASQSPMEKPAAPMAEPPLTGIAFALAHLRNLRDRLAVVPARVGAIYFNPDSGKDMRPRLEMRANPEARACGPVLPELILPNPAKLRPAKGEKQGDRGKMWSMLRLPLDWED